MPLRCYAPLRHYYALPLIAAAGDTPADDAITPPCAPLFLSLCHVDAR